MNHLLVFVLPLPAARRERDQLADVLLEQLSLECLSLLLCPAHPGFPKDKNCPLKGISSSPGTPPYPHFQKCSGHLALGQAHAKHSLCICYFMARAISSVVIFHFCKRFPAGFL